MVGAKEIRELVLDTLWSQWHELGVASIVPRRHADDVIDPEPLIAFTAIHGDLDPRLRDESIDWVVHFGTSISKARLKNILASDGLLEHRAFRQYAATVNAHSNLAWPADRARPARFRSRARSVLEDLRRPALLSFRVRAIAGVGARAEILRTFLRQADLALSAADLSRETSYGKRNVLNELEPLRLAGLVTSFRAANADRFSLAKRPELIALVGPLPARATRWTPTFRVMHLILDLVLRAHSRSDLQNAIDAIQLLDEYRAQFAAAEISPPALPSGPGAWRAFVEWGAAHLKAVART